MKHSVNAKYMKSKERQYVIKKIETLSAYCFEGEINSVIQYFSDLRDKYKNEYETLNINIAWGYDDTDVDLVGRRKESDAEYDARLKVLKEIELRQMQRKEKAKKKILQAEAAKKKNIEESEKALYEKLKKKYGNQ